MKNKLRNPIFSAMNQRSSSYIGITKHNHNRTNSPDNYVHLMVFLRRLLELEYELVSAVVWNNDTKL